VLSDVLGQNKSRMDKFKNDVKNYGISCLVSKTVQNECEDKIKRTTDFLGNTLKDVLVAYLEGVRGPTRDLTSAKPSNNDLHIIEEAFLTINQSAREFDLFSDPFQAIEEWIVTSLDSEVTKMSEVSLSDFVQRLTATVLKEITQLLSDFETLVELEGDYVMKSSEIPDPVAIGNLLTIGIHQSDAAHISSVKSHVRHTGQNAIFITFDYRSILLKGARALTQASGIVCCDPIYGLSHIR
jgi:hypothetical protein